MRSTEGSTRTWLSPLTAVSFGVIGITGLLMFFHLRAPGMTTLHELGGLLFVVTGAIHLALNWRPLLGYCRRRKGLIGLCVGTVLVGLFLAAGLGHEEAHRGPHGQAQHSPASHP